MENWTDLFAYKKRERRGILVLFILVIISVLTSFYASKWSKKNNSRVNENLKQQYEAFLLTEHIEFSQNQSNRYLQPVEKKKPQKISRKEKKENPQPSTQKVERTKGKPANIEAKKIVTQKREALKIDINKASASDFSQLRGIGEVLSKRIVKYREKLGGFVSIEQVGTTYGIESQVFTQIKSSLVLGDTHQVKLLNFNTDSQAVLANHPYISTKLASQIVNFRMKVKPYENFGDIEKLYYFKNQPELLAKLKPYISF